MSLEIDVENCRSCICLRHHYGQGESWDYCDHPKAPDGYKNILKDDKTQVPKWCPIAEKAKTK